MICRSCRVLMRRPPPTLRPILTQSPILLARQHHTRLSSLPQRPLNTSRAFSTSTSSSSTASSRATPAVEEAEEDSPAAMTPAEESIAAVLASELSPTRVLVRDVSGGCGSMYAIEITAARFRGLSILRQQRLVNSALGHLVKEWHGVQIRTHVPEE